MSEEYTIAYYTARALHDGVRIVKVSEYFFPNDPNYRVINYVYDQESGEWKIKYGWRGEIGRDIFLSHDEALMAVSRMIDSKIAEYEHEISLLESNSFQERVLHIPELPKEGGDE